MPVVPTGTFTDVFMAGGSYDPFAPLEWTTCVYKPGDPDGYFWSHFFDVGGDAGYAGLQTRVDPYDEKGFIFSMNTAVDAVAESVDAQVVSTAPEWPDGLSLRMRYEWPSGRKLRHRVKPLTAPEATALGLNPASGQWWRYSVTDLTTADTTHIGSICVDASFTGLTGYSILFTERYGGAVDACWQSQHALGTFTDVTIGGVAPDHYVPHLATGGTCPGSKVTPLANGWRHSMGGFSKPPPTAHAQLFERDNETLVGDFSIERDDGTWWGLTGDSKGSTKRNDDGAGNIEVDHDHPLAGELTIRRVVRLLERDDDLTERVQTAFTIGELDSVEITQSGESDQKVTASGPGLLARLRDSRVVSWVPFGDRPSSKVRAFNFASPGLPLDQYAGTVHQHVRTDQVVVRPIALPERQSQWIAPYVEVPGPGNPTGPWYVRREVYLAADTDLVIFWSMDDRGNVWWDGVECDDQEPAYPADVWWWTWRIPVKAKAGWHTFAAKVINDFTQTAFIASAWTTNGTAIVTPVFMTGTDSSNPLVGTWYMSPTSDPAPAFTGTEIMRILTDEGIDRGSFPTLTRDFDDSHDSNGLIVPRIPELITNVGAHTVHDAADLLQPYYDIDMVNDDGLKLRMFLNDATPDPSGTDLQRSINVQRLTHHIEG